MYNQILTKKVYRRKLRVKNGVIVKGCKIAHGLNRLKGLFFLRFMRYSLAMYPYPKMSDPLICCYDHVEEMWSNTCSVRVYDGRAIDH